MDFYLLVLKNTSDALKSEEKFKQQKIAHSVYPTPPQILGSCGISLRFTEMEIETVLKMIESGAVYKALYKITRMSIIKMKEYDVK